MKILVTGGAGFIGSHLVDAFIAKGHSVAVVDNLDSGHKEFVNPKARFYKVDVSNLAALEKVFAKEKPAVVAHLAAFDHIRLSVEQPENAIKINVGGTLNVLKMMVKYKAKKIMFASTAGPLYGFQPKPLPVDENRKIETVSPYGASKAFAEELIRLYQRLYGIRYTIFRYPNVYGPRQLPKAEAKVIAVFSLMLLKGEQPMLFGDGSKTRDYGHISDVVRAHVLALSKGDNETINIGSGVETKDRDVLGAVQKALGTHVKPKIGKPKPGEAYRMVMNSRKAKKLLGWETKVPFEKGVAMTVLYYQQYVKTGKLVR